MALGFAPGEWDWLYGQGGILGGTPPFLPPTSGGAIPSIFSGTNAPKPQGFLGRLEKALAPYGGTGGLGAQLLANSGRTGSFSEALGNSLLGGQQQVQQSQGDELRRKYLEAQIESMRRPESGPLVPVARDGKIVYESRDAARGMEVPGDKQNNRGAYQPGDYTPESWAEFDRTGDPAVLKRYTTPRQEYSPSFQNVTKTLPDGSTQQGTFDTRTGSYNWSGEIVPPGTKKRADAAGTAEGTITGTRTAKSGPAYNAFQTGVQSLETAMSNTVTGPVAGRFPAVTAAQQTAEGAEATMAPILKQLFRDAGEGTFTDSDQALLMKMVPTRKDHPEARKAKIQMIDDIVRAKLAIDGAPSPGGNQAPQAAIDYLKAHPEAAEQFKAKYGYLP